MSRNQAAMAYRRFQLRTAGGCALAARLRIFAVRPVHLPAANRTMGVAEAAAAGMKARPGQFLGERWCRCWFNDAMVSQLDSDASFKERC